jgi:hypothetical protein
MSLVWTAIVLLAVLSTLNLLFALGIVRRLRQHTDLLRGNSTRRLRLEPGEAVGEFSARSVAGVEVDRDSVRGSLVGVFSATCEPCKALLPGFLEHAATLPADSRPALAVVAGDALETAAMAAQLESVARVVVEEVGGPVCSAFGVTGYPAVFVVSEEGRIESSGGSLEAVLPVASPSDATAR